MIVEWDPTLETGDPTVDSQHRHLVALFNTLMEAEGRKGDSRRLVEDTLGELSVYVATHFGSEEALMDSADVPADFVEMHKKQHRDLTEHTREFVLSYRRGEVDSIEPLVEFLREWLTGHIDEVDRLLIEHLG